jgi:hypothetical protein
MKGSFLISGFAIIRNDPFFSDAVTVESEIVDCEGEGAGSPGL